MVRPREIEEASPRRSTQICPWALCGRGCFASKYTAAENKEASRSTIPVRDHPSRACPHLNAHLAAGDHVGLDALRAPFVSEAADLLVGCQTTQPGGLEAESGRDKEARVNIL